MLLCVNQILMEIDVKSCFIIRGSITTVCLYTSVYLFLHLFFQFTEIYCKVMQRIASN
uniref:Uncharacterized protein n=1 Tax=Trichinella spiralis TaxID=6334 RepID=Q94817_TRISP|nr:cDNA isolated by RT-PCR of mRNA using nematode SL1 primer; possibly trans-spliced with nematode splice leader sequence SL1; hypothetical protein [Trichinella spiralis]